MNDAIPPFVSIIMPCRNSEATLVPAVSSVLAQDYEAFELLIVDDGSTDNSVAIAQNFCEKDRRVRLLFNRGESHGASYARNTGLAACRGKMIAFLDSDDLWFRWALADRISRLRDTGASIVYGPYLRLLSNGTTTQVTPRKRVSYRDMLHRNQIGNLTGLYDAQALGIEFQANVPHEDYLMWCKLIQRGAPAVATLGRPLGIYRVSAASLSGHKGRAFLWHWRVLRDELHVPLYEAAVLQAFYAIDSLVHRIMK